MIKTITNKPKKKELPGNSTIANNRKARFNYHIEDQLEVEVGLGKTFCNVCYFQPLHLVLDFRVWSQRWEEGWKRTMMV